MDNNKVILIGKGYWGNIIYSYLTEYFNKNVEVFTSKSNLNIAWNSKIKDVFIITPIDTHYELCKKAIKSGKNIFIEKPITETGKEAAFLYKLAKINNSKILVDYVQTFSESILFIQKLINELTPVEYIEMATKHLGRYMKFDVFKLLGSHHLSILGTLFDISSLNFSKEVHLVHNDIATTGSIKFDFGRIDISVDYPYKEMYMNLYGNGWKLIYNPLCKYSVKLLCHTKKLKNVSKDLIYFEQKKMFNEKHNLINSIKYFYDVIDGKKKSNLGLACKISKILNNL